MLCYICNIQLLAVLFQISERVFNLKVVVIMGSSSDWETMKESCQMLDQFGIPYDKKVVSAHRTPQLIEAYDVRKLLFYRTVFQIGLTFGNSLSLFPNQKNYP